jgi:hypothetical protein
MDPPNTPNDAKGNPGARLTLIPNPPNGKCSPYHPVFASFKVFRVVYEKTVSAGRASCRLLSRPAGTLSSIANGGEGRGEEVLQRLQQLRNRSSVFSGHQSRIPYKKHPRTVSDARAYSQPSTQTSLNSLYAAAASTGVAATGSLRSLVAPEFDALTYT